MKFNWGTGIFLVIVVFVTGMLTLVFISSSQELNLVTPDYYPKGIDYQNHINKEKHTNELERGISFSQDKEFIYLSFPTLDSINSPKGKVLVFFPKSYRYDKEYDLQTNDSLYHRIAKADLTKGRCIIKINWSLNDIEYYQEESMNLY